MNTLSGEKTRVAAEAAQVIINGLRARASGASPIVVAWCGGTSPKPMFEPFAKAFAELPAPLRLRVHFALIDERRVPRSSPDCNFRMLNELLFTPLIEAKLLLESQLLPFPLDGSPEECCAAYRVSLERLGGISIAVIGAGPDAHIAGLFPHHAALRITRPDFVYVSDRPKPPAEGFTATAGCIEAIPCVFVLIFGTEKRATLDAFLADGPIADAPVRIAKRCKEVTLVTDLELPR